MTQNGNSGDVGIIARGHVTKRDEQDRTGMICLERYDWPRRQR